MILAVIPARGGSKRLPGKNTVQFGGRPLLAWSVAMAQRLDSVVHSVVSTEDRDVAAVARETGADVIERPVELAGDDSPITSVVLHAAQAVARKGITFDAIMLLQPTNPLRPLSMMSDAVSKFMAKPCDSLISVSGRSLKFGQISNGEFQPNYAPDTQSRSTPRSFYENGLLYLTKRDVLFSKGSIYGSRILAFETPRPFDDVDIDTPDDLVIAEALLQSVRSRLGY
jgi:N-acylneuraminate cytidylyltransferase